MGLKNTFRRIPKSNPRKQFWIVDIVLGFSRFSTFRGKNFV